MSNRKSYLVCRWRGQAGCFSASICRSHDAIRFQLAPVWSTILTLMIQAEVHRSGEAAKVGCPCFSVCAELSARHEQARRRAVRFIHRTGPTHTARRGVRERVASILRTKAVRPFPVPERVIITMRDIDTGMEPGELPGPTRERAHSEGE